MRISDWSSDVCSSDLARTLASYEIPVRCGSAAFAGGHLVGVHRQAHRAPRLAPFEAGVDENAIEPFLLGLALDQSRSGHDQRAHPIGLVPAVSDQRSRANITIGSTLGRGRGSQ